MAEASFTIRAIDSTRAAFASVQNSLNKLQSTAKLVGTSIKGAFGFGALLMVGSKLNQTLEDAEKNAKRLGLSAQEVDGLTVATNLADEAAMALQRTVASVASFFTRAFTSGDVAAKASEIRFKRVADQLDEIKKRAKAVFESISGIDDSASVQFARLGDEIAKINREIAESNKSVDAVQNAERQVKIAEKQFDRATIARNAFREMDEALGAAAAAEEDYNMSLMTEAEQQAVITRKLGERMRSMIEIKRLLPEGTEGIDILNATPRDIALMEKMTKDSQEYVRLLGQRKKLETDLERIAKDAGEMISQGFEDAILSGQKLSDVLRNLAQDLIRLVFRNVITAPLAGGISDIIKGAFTFLEKGGPARAGMPHIVGEAGPELFIPGTSGTVIPNDRMGQMGGGIGGPTVNISYNIQSGVSRAELQPILENERKRLRAEIPDMVRRGGSYRAAFA